MVVFSTTNLIGLDLLGLTVSAYKGGSKPAILG